MAITATEIIKAVIYNDPQARQKIQQHKPVKHEPAPKQPPTK